jgi:serine/threonine protein kinase
MNAPSPADSAADPTQPVGAGLRAPDVKRLLDAFEDAWQKGVPVIENFLPPLAAGDEELDKAARRELLEELIKIDLEYRWKRFQAALRGPGGGLEQFRVEEYCARFPQLADGRPLPLTLVCEEYRVRRRWGDRPSADEYAARSPGDCEALLTELRRIDAKLEAESDRTSQGDSSRSVPRSDQTSPMEGTNGTPPTCGPELPDFEIQGVLGCGGMGVVYKARQLSLNRIVAVKMISADRAGATVLARFRAEAEAAARLQHPNIVQIHAVEQYKGQPYFVLEFVAGGNLADYLAANHLPARQAAQLVEALSRATHYAHQQGIVHRDLKPANILLGMRNTECGMRNPEEQLSGSDSEFRTPHSAFRIPKIADFGLAKRLDETVGQTQSGAILGTPSYMAPEQASGLARDVGPAADVYALGAILYETLTGRPPFRAATALATLDQVRSQEPIPLSRLEPTVPRDLETICLKCLHKAPHQRYASALALGEDLQRFLSGSPILARPVRAWERLWKWARRRPAAAALVAVLLLAIVTLLGGGWIMNLRLHAEQQRALRNFEKTRETVNLMLWHTGVDQLSEVPEALEVRLELFNAALQLYRELLEDKRNQDSTTLNNYAELMIARAHLQAERKQWDAAEGDYQEALTLLHDLVGKFPAQTRHRVARASAQHDRGQLQEARGRFKEAEADYEAAVTALDALDSADASVGSSLAIASDSLASILAKTGRAERAEQLFRKAFGLCETRLAAAPEESGTKQRLALTAYDLGLLLKDTNHPKEAEEALRKAIDFWAPLAGDQRGSRGFQHKLAHAYSVLGIQHLADRPAESEKLLKEALSLFEQLAQRDPQRYQDELALGQHNLAQLYQSTGRPGEAEPLLVKAVSIREQLVQENPDNPYYQAELAGDLHNLGHLYAASKRANLALAAYEKAIGLLESLHRKYPEETNYTYLLGTAHGNLGQLLKDLKRHPDALTHANRAVDLYGVVVRKNPQNKYLKSLLAQAYRLRAQVLLELGRSVEASVDLGRMMEQSK